MFRLHRVLIGYAVAIPMALILGYLVATPDMTSLAVMAMVLFFLALPLLIQWNHFLLIFLWNSAFVAGFLPGAVPFWTIFAMLTFGMGVVHRVMGHKSFLRVPELTRPMLFFGAVVLLTAKIRGGIGVKSFGGSSFGGRHYFFVLAGIVGYFALTSQTISLSKSARATKWFFLSGLSYGLANLAYALGPAFYFIYYLIPTDAAMSQAQADFGQDVVKRFAGLAPFATGLFCFMLVRWGVRGLFVWSKPWKLLLLLLVIFASLLSGFRGQLGFFVILFVVQFIVEGLWKTAFLPAAVLLAAVSLTPVLLFANKMPLAVQRTFAFLPVNIEPQVRDEAADSIQWRLDMWHEVWPEVPKYLLIGKGYAIDPLELYLTSEAIRMGIYSSYEDSVLAGDYHNGALSVLMPFGIFGAIGFLWLLGAGIKVLYLNRRYGDPQLKSINTLFLSYFITQCIMFFFVFGALDSPQCAFWGVLGLSVSLNGGVCRKKAMTKQSFAQPALEPAFAAA